MKEQVTMLDATPSKRSYLSIISDYDLPRSICELVDNALDIWVKDGKKNPLKIQIDIDKYQQTIRIEDSAGGIKEEDMPVIVSPGQTTNKDNDEVIGIFGVGSKRAVIALAQAIRITTRHGLDETFQIEYDDDWIGNDDWDLPLQKVDSIQAGTTIITLNRLRIHITDVLLSQLKEHLEATYARFLTNDLLVIQVNGNKLRPSTFEDWAYPPTFEPRYFKNLLVTQDGQRVIVEVLAGLTNESSPVTGEYGVYFYCNDRLVCKALKSADVGFTKGLAGLPHPHLALTRVIVSLKGESRSMPWNSSKSGINTNHVVFKALQERLIEVVKEWASLSRRLEGQWEEKVFRYSEGEIKQVIMESLPAAMKSYLPPLPKTKLRYSDKIKQANKQIAKDKPWTIGSFESIIAVDLLFKQKLAEKNRICLILLDSALEIAFKEYLVFESGVQYSDQRLQQIFGRRDLVQTEVGQYKKSISYTTWRKITFYYYKRCKLVHERSSVQISDYEVQDYREVVEGVLNQLFGLVF